MRRGRALQGGRWLSLIAVGLIGYLLGDWHAVAVRSTALSAAQNVALRFPEANAEPAGADAAGEAPATTTNAIVLGDASAILLSPDPMIPVPAPQPAATAPVRVAAAEDAETAANPGEAVRGAVAPPQAKAAIKPIAAMPARSESKPAAMAEAVRHNRAGFLLNDAQIASIKNRLHLTPEQEQMWPAVEAALRNIAYAKRRPHGHGGDGADVASLDPYSPEVQGLKSAAVPLIMSFSDQQRSQVRSLAHVMGLDQLASQI
jgi:hypothetical protein